MLHGVVKFLHLVVVQRQLIYALAKREIASQYIGSVLGIVWTFIQPAVMIFVFWFVFSVGFKTKPMNDVPFAVWLTAGMAPWFAFSDIVVKSAQAVVGYGHLIKKSVFPSQILPVVKILSSMSTHFAFVGLLLLLMLSLQVSLTWHAAQFFYYLFCLSFLALGIGWIVAALNVFIRDVGQIVSVLMQIGFWATPIFWDLKIMPDGIQQLIKFNPVYYIIQGYRDAFLYGIPFWERPLYTVYFWVVAVSCFFFGVIVFRKLKGQFADVL